MGSNRQFGGDVCPKYDEFFKNILSKGAVKLFTLG